MSLFKGMRKERREPQDRIRLTANLSAPFWAFRDRETGMRHVYWSVDRVDPDNDSVSYRMIRCKDLLEMPEFIRQTAEIFAELEFLPSELRKKFARLSFEMAQAGERLREQLPNGEEDDHGGSKQNRAFAL